MIARPRYRSALPCLWLCALCACEPDASSERAPAEPSPPSQPSSQPSPPSQDTERASGAAKSEPAYRRTKTMMGTVISIMVVGESEERAGPAVDAAFAEMEGLEALLSEWRPDSEISRINAAAGKRAIEVSEHTMRVIQAGLDVSRWSRGAFDMSWAVLHGLYIFQPDRQRLATPQELRERLPLIDYRKVAVDTKKRTVKLEKPGMKIGTGGIAKGYALDRAAAQLRDAGIDNFMLFGGGQVQVSGQREGRAWRVGIQHPRRNDYFAFLEAKGGSISTSGDYEHAFTKDGKRFHHILDLETGRPVEHTASVTVLADSGLYADALSTAVFVLGAERALATLDNAPGGAQFVLVGSDMSLHVSPGLKDRLIMRADLTEGKLAH